MIQLSNTLAQTLSPGQSIIFDDVLLHSGNGECHRKNTSSVKLRCNGIYEVEFHGNVTGATDADPVNLGITLGATVLPETRMIYTPAAANAVGNVGTATEIRNCCGDYDRVQITNIGTNPITVSPNTSLIIKRRN